MSIAALDCLLPSQAARVLGVSLTYVRRLADAGRLEVVRGPMGIRLIDRASVEELARERAQGGCQNAQHAGLGVARRSSVERGLTDAD